MWHVIARDQQLEHVEIHSKKMSTAAQLLVGGERTSGESIRSQNGKDNNNRMHPEIIFNFFFSDGCSVSGQYS